MNIQNKLPVLLKFSTIERDHAINQLRKLPMKDIEDVVNFLRTLQPLTLEPPKTEAPVNATVLNTKVNKKKAVRKKKK